MLISITTLIKIKTKSEKVKLHGLNSKLDYFSKSKLKNTTGLISRNFQIPGINRTSMTVAMEMIIIMDTHLV